MARKATAPQLPWLMWHGRRAWTTAEGLGPQRSRKNQPKRKKKEECCFARIYWIHRDFSSLPVCISGQNQAVELLSTSYTHWGRKLCPAGKQHNGTIHMAYSGVVAGPSDTLPGSAANALCMPLRPQWRGFDDQRHYGGRIYGATYRLGVLTEGTYNVFDGNAEPGRLNRQAVPCAVCRVRRATTVLHLPATRECPSGFRRLYDGYLLSAAAAQFKSQYLCVDKRPEFSPVRRQQAHAGTPEMSLYPVEAGCSDKLPCQQFPGSRELTCVVCVA